MLTEGTVGRTEKRLAILKKEGQHEAGRDFADRGKESMKMERRPEGPREGLLKRGTEETKLMKIQSVEKKN